MTFIVLLFEVLFSLSTSLFLIYYFGNIFKQNLFVTISSLTVWFFSFIVIFLLPLDISSSFYDACFTLNTSNNSCQMPYSYISHDPVRIIWLLLYWILQILSWVILPLFQSFVSVHYFSIWKRLLWAFIQNCFVFVSLILICIVVMIFLIVKEGWNFSNIISMAVTASNVWVLFFLIILVGYGLVELPRSFLQRSRYCSYLNFLYFRASKTYSEKIEAEINMQDTEKEIRYFQTLIKYNDPLYKYMRIVIKNLPSEAKSHFNDEIDDFQDFPSREEKITLDRIEKLNEKAIRSTWNLFLSSTQCKQLTKNILEMEMIINNMKNTRDILLNPKFESHSNKVRSIPSRLYWIWKIYVVRGIYITLFGISFLLSAIILISEVTIFLNQFAKITLLAYVIEIGLYSRNYFSSEVTSILLLAYISLCAYFSVFRIRIFNKYRLCPEHQTNEFSLLFSAILLSRMIISMCLNYLYLVDLARLPSTSKRQSINVKPAFFEIWGASVPEIALLFFIYFPLVIIIVVIFTIFQLDRRILSFFGFQQFIGEDEMTLELVTEGKQYIQLQKKKLEKGICEASIGKLNIYTEYKNSSMLRDVRTSEVPSCKNNSSFTADLVSHFRAYFPLKKAPNILYSSLENTTDTILVTKCSPPHFLKEEVLQSGNSFIQDEVSCINPRDIPQIQCNSSSIDVRADFHANRRDIFRDI